MEIKIQKGFICRIWEAMQEWVILQIELLAWRSYCDGTCRNTYK